MANFTHDPDADLDYGFDWGTKGWLGDDTIAISTWSITKNDDDELVLSTSTHDDTTTTIWADGGTKGTDYTITNHIVTAAGREDDRSHTLRCRER